MNPRFTIAIIIGAFLLGLGTVFGFALGRRTAFFTSQFPSRTDERVEASAPRSAPQSGTVTALDSESVAIALDGGKTLVVKRSDIQAVVAVRPLAPNQFVRSLEAYRSALKKGDQNVQPPSDSVLESLSVTDLKEGMRVYIEGDGDQKKITIHRS